MVRNVCSGGDGHVRYHPFQLEIDELMLTFTLSL